MTYTKYKDIPNRREPLGGRDHIQHIETALQRVVPGPGEVIVGSEDGPVKADPLYLHPSVQNGQLLPAPTIMANPPTIATSEVDAATGITGGVTRAHTDPGFRYFSNATEPFQGGYRGRVIGIASIFRAPLQVEFGFDGDDIEIMTGGGTRQLRILVDGQYAHAPITSFTGTESGVFRTRVTFASRKVRRITVQLANGLVFKGATIKPVDTIWQPSFPLGPRVMFLGDSYTEGQNAAIRTSGFPFIFGHHMGWRDIWCYGIGGTGYVRPHGFGNYLERFEPDVVPAKPDILFVCGSNNDLDGGFTPAQVGTNARALFQKVRAQLPDTLLIVATPTRAQGTVLDGDLDVIDAIATAAEGLAHLVIFPRAEGWFTGTGQVEAPKGNGNADFYSTNFHPTTEGHAYYGYRLAESVAAAFPLVSLT